MVLDKATRNGHDPDWAQPEEVGSGGLSIATLGDLDRALEGIDLGNTFAVRPFRRVGHAVRGLAGGPGAEAQEDPACLRGCIEMDPLGVLSHEGSLPQSLEGAYREMAALTRWAADHAPRVANHLRPQPRLA